MSYVHRGFMYMELQVHRGFMYMVALRFYELHVHRGFMSYRCIVYAVTGALRFL